MSEAPSEKSIFTPEKTAELLSQPAAPINKDAPENKGGRPTKYEDIDLEYVEKLASAGLTDVQIAAIMEIAPSTLYLWKNEHPEFSEALKRGKEVADEKVVKALYSRALGYTHPDVHISNFQGMVTVTPIFKHYPPDPTSCIFWLKKRKPKDWGDETGEFNPDDPASEKSKKVITMGGVRIEVS